MTRDEYDILLREVREAMDSGKGMIKTALTFLPDGRLIVGAPGGWWAVLGADEG